MTAVLPSCELCSHDGGILVARTPRLRVIRAEDAQYPIQQTSCPALYAAPARVDDQGTERRLHAAGTVRTEAYALFLGLAREWAPEADWPIDSVEVRDASGRPVAGVSVTLGVSGASGTDADTAAHSSMTPASRS